MRSSLTQTTFLPNDCQSIASTVLLYISLYVSFPYMVQRLGSIESGYKFSIHLFNGTRIIQVEGPVLFGTLIILVALIYTRS